MERIRNCSDVRVSPSKSNGKVKGLWVNAKANLIIWHEDARDAYLRLKNQNRIHFWSGGLFSLFSLINEVCQKRQAIKSSIEST